MKTVRIRTFFVLVFILISTFPWIAFVVVHWSLTKRLGFGAAGWKKPIAVHETMTTAISLWLAFAVAFGLLFAVFLVAIALRRYIIKPLDAMQLAAAQIATGDLDVDRLSKSRIREIAEVRNGFESMVRALQDSFQKQVALEEERTFIVNAVAHDLRTPLFALRGYLDGLERGIANTPDKMMMYVSVCKESSEQLDRLVADLFAFAQIEYIDPNAFGIQNDTVDIADVVRTSVESIRILAKEKDISIFVDTVSGNTFVQGDRHLLIRVANNLIDNAVRHTPRGGTIRVQLKVINGKTYVSVRDSGTGFTPEDLLHVFEPLYRGDESRNLANGGTGLGLTIAQRIVRRHGGDIMIENNLDIGGTVTFWLPARNCSY